MGTVEVTLVRHAETVSNRTGIWQGQGDSHLSEEGEAQAARLGRRLAGARWDRVVCSDLTRTRQTARALEAPEVTYDPAWREIDVGRWEGLSRLEVLERFPEEIDALKRGESIAIGGGESWRDLERRADAALGRLREGLRDGERALVMTHGGVIHAIVSGLLGVRGLTIRPIGRVMNTAITVLRFHDGAEGAWVEIAAFNDASHVGPESEYLREHLAAGATAVAVLVLPEGASGEDDPRVREVGRWHRAFEAGVTGRLGGSDDLAALERLGGEGRVRGVAADAAAAARLAHVAVGAPAGARFGPLSPGRLAHFTFRGTSGPAVGDYALAPLPFFEP